MTQHELISIMNSKMLQAVRYREQIDANVLAGQDGYWYGVYKAYEEMVQLLLTMDIRKTNVSEVSVTPLFS